MTKRDHRSRQRTHVKPRCHAQNPAEESQPPSDQETVDGLATNGNADVAEQSHASELSTKL